MSNKQQKKLRQLVRRNRNKIESQVLDDFFEMVSCLKFKYRLKLAFKILNGKNLRKEFKDKQNGSSDTGNK